MESFSQFAGFARAPNDPCCVLLTSEHLHAAAAAAATAAQRAAAAVAACAGGSLVAALCAGAGCARCQPAEDIKQAHVGAIREKVVPPTAERALNPKAAQHCVHISSCTHLHEAHVEQHLALKLTKYHCVYSRGPQRRLDLHVEDLNRIRLDCSSASPCKALAQSLNPKNFTQKAQCWAKRYKILRFCNCFRWCLGISIAAVVAAAPPPGSSTEKTNRRKFAGGAEQQDLRTSNIVFCVEQHRAEQGSRCYITAVIMADVSSVFAKRKAKKGTKKFVAMNLNAMEEPPKEVHVMILALASRYDDI
eukprot:8881-Heterococcus_DN1.PRE.1